MTKPKPRPPSPFTVLLSSLDRLHPLPVAVAAEYLGRSRSTLDAWHTRGLPPPRRSENGTPIYRAGDIQDFLDGLPVAGTDADPAGLLDPPMRGGRRCKWAPSCAAFLASGGYEDIWPFAMVDAPAGSGLLRPVDLIAAVEQRILRVPRVDRLTPADYGDALARWGRGALLWERGQKFVDAPATTRGRRDRA